MHTDFTVETALADDDPAHDPGSGSCTPSPFLAGVESYVAALSIYASRT